MNSKLPPRTLAKFLALPPPERNVRAGEYITTYRGRIGALDPQAWLVGQSAHLLACIAELEYIVAATIEESISNA